MENNLETPFADDSNGKWRHLVKHSLDLFEQFSKSEYRAKKIREIRESYAAYEQTEKPTADPWEGANSLTLPLVTISSDNLEPRLVAGLVGKQPYVAFEVENNQKQDQQTEMLQSWFNQELQDHVKIEQVASGNINQLLMEGTVYPMPYYDLDEETQRDFVYFEDVMKQFAPVMQQAQQQMVQATMAANQATQQLGEVPEEVQVAVTQAQEQMQSIQSQIPQQIGGVVIDPKTNQPAMQDKTVKKFEGGRVELVPFTDVFIADDVDDWESATVIRRLRKTYSELMSDSKAKPGFKINGKIIVGPWICAERGESTANNDAVTPSQQMDGIKETGVETIDLIEVSINYVMRDIEKEEHEHKNYEPERLIAWIHPETKMLIRLIPLRELNFKNEHLVKRMRLFPRKGKSYGTSIGGKLKAIQTGMSKVFNTSLNIAELLMLPYGFFDKGSGCDRYALGRDNKLKLAPGGMYPIDNVKGLLFPSFNVNPQMMFPWLDMFSMFWERVLSIGDLQVGRQGQKDTTATETMAVLQEGNVKHNYQSGTIKEDFLSIVRTLYDLYYQYMPLNKTFLWNGQEVEINRKLMARGYKFRLTGSTDLSNKLIERKEKETFHSIASADPNINPVKSAEELVKSYGYTDLKEWVSPGIRQIVDAITTIPGAQQAVMQVLNEAQQAAQTMEEGAKNGKGQ